MDLDVTRGGAGKTSSVTGQWIPSDEDVLARCVAEYEPAYKVIIPDLPEADPLPVDSALLDEIAKAVGGTDGR